MNLDIKMILCIFQKLQAPFKVSPKARKLKLDSTSDLQLCGKNTAHKGRKISFEQEERGNYLVPRKRKSSPNS